MATSVIVEVPADGSGAPPIERPATPEEQAALDRLAADEAARVVAVGTRTVAAVLRTTDELLREVFRVATSPKHVYRATLGMTAIDAGNGVTRDSEVRLVFKRPGATVVQVGATTVLSNVQDAAASTWRIVPSVDGTDLVISVAGAAGRAIDWSLAGSIGAFAPEGLEA